MANWIIQPEKDFSAINKISISEVLLKILSNRGFDSTEKAEDFLEADYEKGVHDPFLFFDMQKIIDRIGKARNKKEKVVIFGDYDADGVTSSVILKKTFEELNVLTEVYIPDKKTEGYGFNILAIEEFAKKGISLIISVDCGITGTAEVEKAKQLGIDIIITDHHHVPENIPKAFAIINPKMKNSGYPFSDLAGVGVAYKLAQALFEKFMPEKKEHVKWMLDLVAIGTVADCVPLVGENRIFVKYGLLVLSKTKRIGLLQLFSVAKLNTNENNFPSTRNIGFHIAPRINAAGRINHANLAYNLLIEEDTVKARILALELEDSNSKRQKITETVVKDVKLLASVVFKDKNFIFAVDEKYPIGIVGLVAGKVVQEFNKPTAVLQRGETESKGSFRSIPQINIIELIERCSDLLIKFGGHSQAAGISIENSKLNAFQEKLEAEIEKELAGKDISPQLKIDMQVYSEDVNFLLAEDLEKLKPFGEGNPEPLFVMKKLVIEDIKLLGSNENHIKFLLSNGTGSANMFSAIAFYLAKEFAHLERGDLIDVVFSLQKDEWNGNRKVQFIISDIKKSDQN